MAKCVRYLSCWTTRLISLSLTSSFGVILWRRHFVFLFLMISVNIRWDLSFIPSQIQETIIGSIHQGRHNVSCYHGRLQRNKVQIKSAWHPNKHHQQRNPRAPPPPRPLAQVCILHEAEPGRPPVASTPPNDSYTIAFSFDIKERYEKDNKPTIGFSLSCGGFFSNRSGTRK